MSTFAITIADVRILPWGRDFRSRPKPRFRLVHIGTSFPMVIVSHQHRFLAARTKKYWLEKKAA